MQVGRVDECHHYKWYCKLFYLIPNNKWVSFFIANLGYFQYREMNYALSQAVKIAYARSSRGTIPIIVE